MSERIDWLPDGTPYNPRFGDRYHSDIGGGLPQARDVFLAGCGLPAAWAGQAQWRVLETGFGLGLNFLVTWDAWRNDPARPHLLHFISIEAFPAAADDLRRMGSAHPHLAPLAEELAAQSWGLLPGVHRLAFDDGRVLLTLYIGDAQAMLRQQVPTADSVYLDGFSPQCNPDLWDLHTLKAIARCCHRGTRLATWTVSRPVRDALTQCGFQVTKVPGVPPKRDNLQAVFDPHWEPRTARQAEGMPAAPAPMAPSTCIVIGGGLAGSAIAHSLARRGWAVQVLDHADAPAAGASGLPAGLFAPHVSPDDAILSRLSRAGVRTTLHALAQLESGMDWHPGGVLEHRVDGTPGIPAAWADGPGRDWSRTATAEELAQAGLPVDTVACWHVRAGWVRPPQLVRSLLATPGVTWRGHVDVARLAPTEASAWQALDAEGQMLAEAALVVVAAGPGSMPLLGHPWPVHPLRGQISWGLETEHSAPWPPFPVNGNGSLVPHIPSADGPSWHAGSTFERGRDWMPAAAEQREAHAANGQRLHALLPAVADALAPAFAAAQAEPPAPGSVRHWGAVRCASADRLPIVGPVPAAASPGLWVCTAMGARGLTQSLLCGELLAARLHDEPLPLDAKLARALASERL